MTTGSSGWGAPVQAANAKPTNAGATLGRVLFYDKRLSILNTHSCGSCHEQSLGFTTADRFPTGVLGTPQKRNAMAIANSRYNLFERYFSDTRVKDLENLSLMPIEDPTELGNLLPLLEQKLGATDFYPLLFQAAFGTREITRERIAKALAQFLRSIITYRSRFDQAYLVLDGDDLGQEPLVLLRASERDQRRSEQLLAEMVHGRRRVCLGVLLVEDHLLAE